MTLATTHEQAQALLAAIRQGNVTALRAQLDAEPGLGSARLVDERGVSRTLLHVVADWPGHVPNGAQMVALLVAAGADVQAPVVHALPHGSPETALHWAASSDDVAVLDALLDHGADIEAPGAVLTGGTAMSDAVVFAQWRAARRLLARGATTTLWQAAALGLTDRVRELAASRPTPTLEHFTNALWHACRGAQHEAAVLLVGYGANTNWIGHDRKSALDVARESGNDSLVAWLQAHGAKPARALEA